MNRKKMIVGIVVIVVLLLGLAFGLLFFKTDVLDFLKSPKDMFFKYSADMFGITGKESNKDKLGEKSYSQNSKVSWEIEDNSGYGMLEGMDVLNSFSLEAQTNYEASSKSMSSKVDFKYENQSLLNLLMAIERTKPEKITVGLPNVLDESITVENRNLKALAQKLGLDSTNVPDQLDLSSYESLMFTDEELEGIKERYLEVLMDGVDKDSVERSSEEIEIDGKDEKVTAYTLTLTQKDVLDIAVSLLEEVKKDDVILDKLVGILETSGQYGKTEITSAIDYAIEELQSTPTSEDGELELIIYQKGGDAVRFEVKIGAKGSLVIDKVVDEDETTMQVKMVSNGAEMVLMDIKIVKEGKRTETTLSIPETSGMSMSLKLVTSEDNTYEELEMNIEASGISAMIRVENSREFKDVQIEKGNGTKSLNDMTTQEIQGLVERYGTALTTYYQNNQAFNEVVELIQDLSSSSSSITDPYGATPSYPTTSQQTDVSVFNSKFTSYTGTQTGLSVNSLMITVSSSNYVYPEYPVTVYNNGLISTPETVQGAVDDTKTYMITLGYGADGYVNRVNISE